MSARSKQNIALFVAATALAAVGLGAGGAAVRHYKVVRAKPLPEKARRFLTKEMVRHGADTRDLVMSAIALDLNRVAGYAGRIAATPVLARPAEAGEGTLNTLFPSKFFELQAAMHRRADALVRIAKAGEEQKIGEALGQLVTSCANCHALYRLHRFE